MTRVRKQPIIALYFDFETVLNIEAWSYSLTFVALILSPDPEVCVFCVPSSWYHGLASLLSVIVAILGYTPLLFVALI